MRQEQGVRDQAIQHIELIELTAVEEAQRVMTICNACRYCEGLCATFQAMTKRRTFAPGDLDYLANLCHNCTACFHDCQYAAPHQFDINVPRSLARLRADSYQRAAGVYVTSGWWLSVLIGASLGVLLLLGVWLIDAQALWSAHTGPGAFYAIVPHNWMVAVAGTTFLAALVWIALSLRRFGRSLGPSPGYALSDWRSAVHHAVTLKQLDGGHGDGCPEQMDVTSNRRRVYHHLTLWGFLLCFAATSVATLYHYLLDWPAPYPLLSLPVILGTVGGVGLLIGPIGLHRVRQQLDPATVDAAQGGAASALIWQLFWVSLTGLVLLALRDTTWMGLLLLIHLGFVLGLFLTLPISKFAHGAYRFVALLRFAQERDRA